MPAPFDPTTNQPPITGARRAPARNPAADLSPEDQAKLANSPAHAYAGPQNRDYRDKHQANKKPSLYHGLPTPHKINDPSPLAPDGKAAGLPKVRP